MGGSEVQSLYVEWKKAEVWGGVSSPEGPRASFSRPLLQHEAGDHRNKGVPGTRRGPRGGKCF